MLHEGCPWDLAWPHHTSTCTIAGTFFCLGTLLSWVTFCILAIPIQMSRAAVAAEQSLWNGLSVSFPSMALPPWAGLLFCPAVDAARPVSGIGESFRRKWGTSWKRDVLHCCGTH